MSITLLFSQAVLVFVKAISDTCLRACSPRDMASRGSTFYYSIICRNGCLSVRRPSEEVVQVLIPCILLLLNLNVVSPNSTYNSVLAFCAEQTTMTMMNG